MHEEPPSAATAHSHQSLAHSHSENLPKGALLHPWVAYLGLEDAVLLPKMVYDSEDAQGPREAQQVGQDSESTAEDQASPKGVAECPPDGPGPLWTLCVLLLPRETHGQVRVAEGLTSLEAPASCCLGKPSGHICCK